MPEGFLSPCAQDHSDTVDPGTKEQIDTLLRNAKKGSATGLDSVTYEMLAHVETALPGTLLATFQVLQHHGMFPESWKYSVCVPIPKPGQADMSDPENITLISLLSCIGKLFEKALTSRLSKYGSGIGAISTNHMGSRTRLSTTNTWMTSLTKAQEWRHL